jgi:UDP-perosamine 4-acetyltransferase
MKDAVVVMGDSGHAKVCIELLQAMGRQVAFCVGVGDASHCAGVPVLHGDLHLARLRAEGYSNLFVAVGANAVRRRLASAALAQGFCLVNAISPRASISPSARLGQGIAVMAGAVLNAECAIGDLAIINTGATVDHDCRIGLATHIAPQCGLAGNVTVGDETFLGIGCKVIPEIRIGNQVVVGAGAVIVRDIADAARAAGVPARPLKIRSAP